MLELLAQPVHVDGDRGAVAHGVLTPHALVEGLPAEDGVRPLGQEQQELVLAVGECDFAVCHAHGVRGGADTHVAKNKVTCLGFVCLNGRRGSASCALGSGEARLHASHEHAWRERLGHVVVGANAQAADHVDVLAARSHHDDGDARALAD